MGGRCDRSGLFAVSFGFAAAPTATPRRPRPRPQRRATRPRRVGPRAPRVPLWVGRGARRPPVAARSLGAPSPRPPRRAAGRAGARPGRVAAVRAATDVPGAAREARPPRSGRGADHARAGAGADARTRRGPPPKPVAQAGPEAGRQAEAPPTSTTPAHRHPGSARPAAADERGRAQARPLQRRASAAVLVGLPLIAALLGRSLARHSATTGRARVQVPPSLGPRRALRQPGTGASSSPTGGPPRPPDRRSPASATRDRCSPAAGTPGSRSRSCRRRAPRSCRRR